MPVASGTSPPSLIPVTSIAVIPGLKASELEAGDASRQVDLSGIQQAPVQAVAVNALSIPSTPRERAGLELSKIVLCLTGLSIAALLSYLTLIDVIGRFSLKEAYQHVYMQVESGGEVVNTVGIADISATFRGNPEKDLSTDENLNLKNFLQAGLRAKSISDRQSNQINSCIGKKDLAAKQDCADLIDVALKASNNASINADKIRAFAEFAKTVDEHQRSFQSFWLQAAQLILLNLFLPLLTGLFGYIFGTSQAANQQRTPNGS